MKKLMVFLVVLGLSSAFAGPALAQPEWPGFIELVNPAVSAGECQPDGTLSAGTLVGVNWADAPEVPVAFTATLSVDGGAPIDVPVEPPVLEKPAVTDIDDAFATYDVPATTTRTEWTVTATPEGYAPVVLSDLNISRNPAGFCAHLLPCHPSYEGVCVPNIETDGTIIDVDCSTGEGIAPEGDSAGDGPRYVEGPITVVGEDVYGLDGDGDGIACEVEVAVTEPPTAAAAVRTRPAFTG